MNSIPIDYAWLKEYLKLNEKMNYSRKALLRLKISEFDMPPMQDMLIIGKKAPIGPEAVRRMAEALSPDQFTIIRVDHAKIEAVLVRNSLLTMMDEPKLVSIVLEEADKLISETAVLRSELKIEMFVQREVDMT